MPQPDLYFIQAVLGGPVKIGVSKNPVSRLTALQTGVPYQLRILATVYNGGMGGERQLHRMFSEYRLSGEWFTPAPAVLRTIRRAASLAIFTGSGYFMSGPDMPAWYLERDNWDDDNGPEWLTRTVLLP